MAAEALEHSSRREPALARSFALALAVHAVLIAVMFIGVRWQSRPPETVTVELWEQPAPPAPPPPPPVVEAPKPPPEPPKVVPEPPKPEPKIEKPEIVEKAPKPKPKPKPEPKIEKPKPKPDPQFVKRMQEEAAREEKALAEQNRVREARAAAEKLAAAANKKALDDWVAKIRSRVKSRMGMLPPNLTGNPEAVFDVVLLPSGDVLDVRKRQSSGHQGYDDVVERAIRNSTPFPKPDQPSVFQRQLELRFRPKDE